MLEIRNICLNYKKKIVLNNFSLKASQPGIILIKGDSGKGKSTLLYSIYGIKTPKKGEIYIFGKKVNNLNVFKLNNLKKDIITYVAPELNLINELTLEENLNLLDINLNQFIQLSEIFNLKFNDFNLKVNCMSSGERTKGALIIAILKHYKIYLFDEIYGSLDEMSKKILKDLLKGLKKDSLILLATQDDTFEDIADQVIVL